MTRKENKEVTRKIITQQQAKSLIRNRSQQKDKTF